MEIIEPARIMGINLEIPHQGLLRPWREWLVTEVTRPGHEGPMIGGKHYPFVIPCAQYVKTQSDEGKSLDAIPFLEGRC